MDEENQSASQTEVFEGNMQDALLGHTEKPAEEDKEEKTAEEEQ